MWLLGAATRHLESSHRRGFSCASLKAFHAGFTGYLGANLLPLNDTECFTALLLVGFTIRTPSLWFSQLPLVISRSGLF